ncbi:MULTISPECIES: ATP-dependent helicase [Pseudomonas]|uniref:ATP-dependent helicase n=1 Tax=Pseudomonas TaxID=286 RepID=UPI001472DA1F|nr:MULTISPECIES: ATP-dependent helicase [Pseudomonas]MEC4242131.1 ATP-dependent helicase [Pseudomonas sp. DSV-1]NNB34051.1 ATP-dependent helicase [Pseudomonas fragi]
MALSPQQQEIVHHPFEEPALVLAVAGSGKSTTMVERIARLVEAGRFDPTRVIAVMFNLGAAKNLRASLERRLGKRNAPQSVTFHSLGTITLRRLILGGYAEQWAFSGEPSKAIKFTVEVIETACKKHGHKYPRIVARDFLSFVDRVKSDLKPPAEVFADGDWPARYDWFVQWYRQFEKERHQKKVRFFSDLIYDPVTIMLENPAAAAYLRGGFDHIIIDEYQDICESQQALIRFTAGLVSAGMQAKVMAVGDDDQTIYGWRGAKAEYILRRFHDDFPGATTYTLNRTWRYGHALSCASNYVIAGNSDRADKMCVSGEKAPDTKLFLEYDQPVSGKPKIVSIVEKWLADGGSLTEMVVLVRSYSKSAASQFDLLQHGIPFRIEGGDEASVLENKWVASLIGWMKLAAGQAAINPYAGEPDIGSIIEARKFIDVPSLNLGWEKSGILTKLVLQEPEDGLGFSRFVSNHVAAQNQAQAERVVYRGKLWRKLRAIGKGRSFPKAAILLKELLYFLDIEKCIVQEAGKREEADEIISLVEAFIEYVKVNSKGKSLPEFMNHLQDLLDTSDKAKQETTALLITSCHRAKGMEWLCVIMPSLWQGSFPIIPRSIDKSKIESHLQDERRLFYVAMTRAIRALYFIAPRDPRLDPWLRACKGGNCDDVIPFVKNAGVASQFLYESNLFLSQALPYILAGGKGRDSLKASSPELINQYLEELNCNYRVAKIN